MFASPTFLLSSLDLSVITQIKAADIIKENEGNITELKEQQELKWKSIDH